MFGRPPFYIPDSFVIEVVNLDLARRWYIEKLGLHPSSFKREEDSGLPFIDLELSGSDTAITLIDVSSDSSPTESAKRMMGMGSVRPMLFARRLEKAYEWLTDRGVSVEAIEADSGGNRFFRFRDLEGHFLEMTQET